jgi:hypothetical protein
MATTSKPSPAADRHLRLPVLVWAALGAAAAVASVALVLALSSGGTQKVSTSSGAVAPAASSLGTRYDGGPEEGTRGPYGHPLSRPRVTQSGAPLPSASRFEHGNPTLYNGGHDEGRAGH